MHSCLECLRLCANGKQQHVVHRRDVWSSDPIATTALSNSLTDNKEYTFQLYLKPVTTSGSNRTCSYSGLNYMLVAKPTATNT